MSKPNQPPWLNKDTLINSISDENVTTSEIMHTFRTGINEVFDILGKRIKEQEYRLEELPRLRSELDSNKNKVSELCQKIQALQQVCQYKDERYQEKVREAARLHNICEMNAQSIIGSPVDASLPRKNEIHSITKELAREDLLPRTRKKKTGSNANPFMGVGYVGTQKPAQFHNPHSKMDNEFPNLEGSPHEDAILFDEYDFEYQDDNGNERNDNVGRANSNHRSTDSVNSRLGNIGSVMANQYFAAKSRHLISTVPFKPTSFPATSATATQKFDPKVHLVGQRSKISSDSRNAVMKHNKEMNEMQLRKLMSEPGPNSRRVIFERRRTKLWPHEDSFKRRS